MTVVTGNPSARCSIDDCNGTKPTEDEVEEEDVELKPLEEKKTHENANRVGPVNAETSVAYEQMPIQLTNFIKLTSQSVDAIEKAADSAFATIAADIMIDDACIDHFNKSINTPTLESPDDSSANDGQENDSIELKSRREEQEEDTKNVTEEMKKTEEDVDTAEDIIVDTIVKRNPKGKLLACQPIKRIDTWNKKISSTKQAVSSEEEEANSNSVHVNIIDEAAAIEMTMNDEETEGIMNDIIAKTNPKGKLLAFQPVKRISTWNKKVRNTFIELKTKTNDEEKEENNENVKEDDVAAIVKNFTEDDIAVIVKKLLNNNASLSGLNRERSDATGSDASASISWIPSEDSFLDTDMNGNELRNGKDLNDLSTFLHENQQVAYTMQNTLRAVYRLNDMAQCTANDIADQYDDATYNSSPFTALLGCLDAQFGNAVAPTKPVSILKKRSKSVKFRNDLPKKYTEEENYKEEREEGGMETGLSDRIGDTRDLAEL